MNTLENIKSLCSLISHQKIRQIELLTDVNSNKKINKLYQLIINGEINAEQDILLKLYGGDKSKFKAASKLKSTLYNRLLNTLYFIDISNYSKSKYEIALHRTTKETLSVTLLLERLKRPIAIEIAEKAIKRAMKYDLVESILFLSRKLAQHYSLYDYNLRYSKYYFEILEEYSVYYTQEIKAVYIYSKLGHFIFNSKKIDNLEGFDEKLKSLQLFQKSNKNYNFNFLVFNSLYFYCLLKKDYVALLEVSSKAIPYFESKNDFSPVGIFTFNFLKGYSLFVLNRPKESLTYYNIAKETNPSEGSLNWFTLRGYLFNNYLLLQEYKSCYSLALESLNNKNLDKLPDQYLQNWIIKEAYLHFLIKLEKVPGINKSNRKLRAFRLNRFLNEVPHFSKDKRGLNIAILIIQMLFYLADRKYNNFIDRMDALKQYAYRYLRNDENLRSNCFIKMILKIPDANYHPIAVQRHVKRFYNKMIQAPPEISEHAANVEIIPYETLWEMVLELLEKNRM